MDKKSLNTKLNSLITEKKEGRPSLPQKDLQGVGSRASRFFSILLILISCLKPNVPLALSPGKEYLEALKKIHLEVKGFDRYPGEDFVRRDFFVGPDDDDTNKDIHVSILIQETDGHEKMTIQVTFLERSPGDPRVRFAKLSRLLACLVNRNEIEIQKSDFEPKEIQKLAPEILRAIRDKKKLLGRGCVVSALRFMGLTDDTEDCVPATSLCGSGRPGLRDWPAPRG